MIQSLEMPTRLKVKQLLDELGVTVYRLSQETEGKLSRQSLYNLTSSTNPPKRIELESLDAIIEGLRTITGRSASVCDLLEYDNA